MVTAMYQVEFAPLGNRERAQHGMVENFCIRSESLGTSGHHLIHFDNF